MLRALDAQIYVGKLGAKVLMLSLCAPVLMGRSVTMYYLPGNPAQP